jgi:hypothetical protein
VSGAGGLLLVTLPVMLVALTVIVADSIPANRRPDDRAETLDGHPIIWTDNPRPTGVHLRTPRDLPEVVIELDRRRRTAAELDLRRRIGLRRHEAALLAALNEVRDQLAANTAANTRPLPVLDEQPTGGER